ncbi:MAG TPA: PadR family transcriptional regulator [Acidimicrobiales bacterium]|nr:PadR family transcriptional regulator [Acidimicrobiales bacterium]
MPRAHDDHHEEHHGPRGRGGFGGRGRGGRGGRSQANRGDIRAAVLALLTEQPMHGYQIIQELAERTGGVWQPSPGSVYPSLQLLADEGLVASTDQDGRKVFALTAEGTTRAAEAAGDAPPWERLAATAGSVDLRHTLGGVAAATRQVATTGTAEQVVKADAILTEARKRLYQLLAE